MRTRMLLGAISLVFIGSQALAEGDVAAGKAKYDAECEECHYDDDFSGETAADIAAWIQEIVDGDTEHKSDLAGLSAEDIANLAAFYASK